MLDPINQHTASRDEPEKGIHQINPNGILHPSNAIVIIASTDIHLAKDTKEGDPQDEEDQVPGEEQGDARDEGDEVECCGHGGEGCSHFCVDLGLRISILRWKGEGKAYPFSVAVLVLAVCFVQIDAVKTADCEGEDELDEAEY